MGSCKKCNFLLWNNISNSIEDNEHNLIHCIINNPLVLYLHALAGYIILTNLMIKAKAPICKKSVMFNCFL